MTQEQLNRLIANPQELSSDTLEPLHKLVETYPYAPTLVFLYLYNLALLRDVRYAHELERLAYLLPDREKLFALAELRLSLQEVLRANEAQAPADSFSVVDKFLQQARSQGDVLPNELTFASEEALSVPTGVDSLALPTDLMTPAATAVSSAVPDYFAASAPPYSPQEPSFVPPTAHSAAPKPTLSAAPAAHQPLLREEADEPAPLFTETLAGIYIKQHKYERAAQIITDLSLKYPQKSGYFAKQLDFLQKLIRNENYTPEAQNPPSSHE